MKKRMTIIVVLLASCIVVAAAQKSLPQLKAEVAGARPQDQVKLYAEIAKLEMDQAESFFNSGDAQKGQAAVADVTSDCESAAQTSIDTRKRLKETEISLRKVSERMDTLSKSVEFEDRPPIKAAVDRIDKARNSLLNAMFKKK